MEIARTSLNKVPEVTIVFWIIKIMSTTVGETGADYLAVHVGLGTAVTAAIMVAFLATALIWQVRTPRYTPWIYWLTVVLVSVVGTQITDFLTDRLEISLYVSTAAFALLLALTFALWRSIEHTLSIHTIVTAGTLLLGRHSLHLCARHRGWRPRDRGVEPGLQSRRPDFRSAHRSDRRRLRPRRQCGPHLLARLHSHPTARRLARRSLVSVA